MFIKSTIQNLQIGLIDQNENLDDFKFLPLFTDWNFVYIYCNDTTKLNVDIDWSIIQKQDIPINLEKLTNDDFILEYYGEY